MRHELHHLVKRGNLVRVREILSTGRVDVNAKDSSGCTPLMHAAISPQANVELVRLLLEHGADIHQQNSGIYGGDSIIALALGGGDPLKVTALLEHGADIHYKRDAGYDALIDSVHGRDVLRDPQLIDLLRLLIASGVALNGVTIYNELGLGVLSYIGRFDAVRLLLDAGADEALLKWTPLIRAVAFGSFADVKKVVEGGVDLEERDRAKQTAWLMAIQTGDIAKARFLLDRGADASARGHCARPSLFYAIENHHTPMLSWLLEIGTSIEQTNEFGTTALMAAVECENAEAVDALLKAGADVNGERDGQTALSFVRTREIAILLLNAGSDPQQLPFEGRRALLGFDPDADEALLSVSPSEFLNGRSRRFGTGNPEEIFEPFCEGMIRAGINAHLAAHVYEEVDATKSPVWCAQRFGQSITFLPDGRIVQIAGEHEDSYDKDFCIYNDVFVHEPDGTIRIFGYPESVFPPTDFQTATLIGEYIYLIGSLGYLGTRQFGTTPVYRLNTKTLRIEPVKAGGEAPGWIFKHRAIPVSAHEIRVSGGTIVTLDGDQEIHTKNEESFIFDTQRLFWHASAEFE